MKHVKLILATLFLACAILLSKETPAEAASTYKILDLSSKKPVRTGKYYLLIKKNDIYYGTSKAKTNKKIKDLLNTISYSYSDDGTIITDRIISDGKNLYFTEFEEIGKITLRSFNMNTGKFSTLFSKKVKDTEASAVRYGIGDLIYIYTENYNEKDLFFIKYYTYNIKTRKFNTQFITRTSNVSLDDPSLEYQTDDKLGNNLFRLTNKGAVSINSIKQDYALLFQLSKYLYLGQNGKNGLVKIYRCSVGDNKKPVELKKINKCMEKDDVFFGFKNNLYLVKNNTKGTKISVYRFDLNGKNKKKIAEIKLSDFKKKYVSINGTNITDNYMNIEAYDELGGFITYKYNLKTKKMKKY